MRYQHQNQLRYIVRGRPSACIDPEVKRSKDGFVKRDEHHAHTSLGVWHILRFLLVAGGGKCLQCFDTVGWAAERASGV